MFMGWMDGNIDMKIYLRCSLTLDSVCTYCVWVHSVEGLIDIKRFQTGPRSQADYFELFRNCDYVWSLWIFLPQIRFLLFNCRFYYSPLSPNKSFYVSKHRDNFDGFIRSTNIHFTRILNEFELYTYIYTYHRRKSKCICAMGSIFCFRLWFVVLYILPVKNCWNGNISQKIKQIERRLVSLTPNQRIQMQKYSFNKGFIVHLCDESVITYITTVSFSSIFHFCLFSSSVRRMTFCPPYRHIRMLENSMENMA